MAFKLPKIGGTAASIASKAKSVIKANTSEPVRNVAGDVWSLGVKQPVNILKTQAEAPISGGKAVMKAIRTGSVKPITEWGKRYVNESTVQPAQRAAGTIASIGQNTGILPSSPQQSAPQFGAGPDYSQFKLNLTSSNPMAEGQVNPQDQIRQQFASMQSLAKMREGAASQADQTAIQRRLAASGMGSSGAGMRMQQQASDISARRLAEQQLGLGAQEAAALQQAGESAKERDFRERQFEYQKQKEAAEFETNKAITAENQRIAREVQRYNNMGLFEQLGRDLFGSASKSVSMKSLFGG